jgi:hypothetical protein
MYPTAQQRSTPIYQVLLWGNQLLPSDTQIGSLQFGHQMRLPSWRMMAIF